MDARTKSKVDNEHYSSKLKKNKKNKNPPFCFSFLPLQMKNNSPKNARTGSFSRAKNS